MAKSENYYPAFDYLRIVLATTVALGHSGAAIWPNAADLSVQIFFAMSGWLIGGILLRSNSKDLPRFYYNRAARIWIPYFIAILLLIFASLLKDPITSKWQEIFFYDATFVYNVFGPPQLAAYGWAMPLAGTGNHFWSICAEEQFYLLAPFLLVLLPKIGRTIAFWIILSIGVMLSPFSTNFAAICLGVLAAVARQRLGNWHTSRLAQAVLACLAVSLFLLIFFPIVDYHTGAPLFSICLVMLLARTGSYSSIAAFIGGVSFPMYLNHWIGTFIANAVYTRIGLRDSFLSHISGVFAALILATILYLLVDRLIKKYRDRYFTLGYGKLAAALAVTLVSIGLAGGLLITGAIPPS